MQEESIQAPKHQLLAIKEILLASTGLLSFLNYAAACDCSAFPERQRIAGVPEQQALGRAGNLPTAAPTLFTLEVSGQVYLTEWLGLEGTSVGHPAQPSAQAGSPTVGCRGAHPGQGEGQDPLDSVSWADVGR